MGRVLIMIMSGSVMQCINRGVVNSWGEVTLIFSSFIEKIL